jgi:dTDP-glucose pyrophosphorylase
MSKPFLGDKAILDKSSTIEDVIKNLEDTGLQICMIASEELKLIGVITDGDIRRGLLNGVTLKSKANKIMVKNPITIDLGAEDTAMDIMKKNMINHVPVINTEGQIINLYSTLFDTQSEKKDNIFVIMAGGFGKRLAPYTDTCPKPMLSINGKPMLEHIIDSAISEGFHNFVISVFYLSEVIIEYFGDGSDRGININYIKENNPLGTAGALSMIDPVPALPFVITNGDVMTNIKYSDVLHYHDNNNSSATMVIRRHGIQNPFGVVILEDMQIKGFQEKPIYTSNINAGIYVLDGQCLGLLNLDEVCDMPTLFTRVSSKKDMKSIAFPMHEEWVDIGNIDDYHQIINETNSN